MSSPKRRCASSIHCGCSIGRTAWRTLPAPWTGNFASMVADGRLTYVNTVNGKKLYTLDRKKLGMPE